MAQPWFDLEMGSKSASGAPLGCALFLGRGGLLPHLASNCTTFSHPPSDPNQHQFRVGMGWLYGGFGRRSRGGSRVGMRLEDGSLSPFEVHTLLCRSLSPEALEMQIMREWCHPRKRLTASAVAAVAQPPNDSISSLSFSPKGNILVATSWDNQVRCWEIHQSGTNLVSQPKAAISHDHPVLCSTWKEDGTTVFSGGCDKQVKMWPLGGQPVTVAMHDAPIKEIAWIPEMSLLVTGSLDKTLKYWDVRQPNPVHTQQLPERCYALSVRYPLMVVGTADRNLIVFNLQNPQTEFKRILSPLKYQTRCVAAFPDQQGFLVGSIEGRVGVQHLDEKQNDKNFTFKCRREGTRIYSVNSLNFHPDQDSQQRLKEMSRCNQPIPCSTFNNDGSIFAYAVCFDWGKGAEKHNLATAKNYIFLHVPQEAEVKRKPRVNTGGKR
ncbi:protein RAE1 [Prunus yedoensis var. nudiflora]|uniref:Protein RAE1 n=1 Tax=Prunus yedoensis var. nudiflora TaxID=2094558 RepID=A0A314Z2B3_PRUYE|nr:protein RAE1 [Prunus yedoensis var. nudiflora]